MATPDTFTEVRQSLWYNPPSGNDNSNTNVSFGFYADGFFDRRARVTPPGTTPGANSVVSYHDSTNTTLNRLIAAKGGLFFNPNTYASLFFPIAGERGFGNGGALFGIGTTASLLDRNRRG
jgi:hypothetical protein